MSSVILKAFNNHFDEFVADIQSIFPDNKDVLTAKNSLSMLRKTNPKTLIMLWNQYIVSKYDAEISLGDINFFINKDYSTDVSSSSGSSAIMDAIDKFKQPIADMDFDNQKKACNIFKT